MKRFTKKRIVAGIERSYVNDDDCCDTWSVPRKFEGPAIERLADYEDAMPLERAQELAKAEHDERLVVLPCKVGDTVFKLCPISPILQIGDLWDGKRVADDCDRCAWKNCDCHDVGPHFDGRYENIIHKITVNSLQQLVRIMPYFGSIYFISSEEAEAALKK